MEPRLILKSPEPNNKVDKKSLRHEASLREPLSIDAAWKPTSYSIAAPSVLLTCQRVVQVMLSVVTDMIGCLRRAVVSDASQNTSLLPPPNFQSCQHAAEQAAGITAGSTRPHRMLLATMTWVRGLHAKGPVQCQT